MFRFTDRMTRIAVTKDLLNGSEDENENRKWIYLV